MTRSFTAQSRCQNARIRYAAARPAECKACNARRAQENHDMFTLNRVSSEAVGALDFSPRTIAPKAR
eukprot:2924349-Pleurochrysis_carterae.AAC.1